MINIRITLLISNYNQCKWLQLTSRTLVNLTFCSKFCLTSDHHNFLIFSVTESNVCISKRSSVTFKGASTTYLWQQLHTKWIVLPRFCIQTTTWNQRKIVQGEQKIMMNNTNLSNHEASALLCNPDQLQLCAPVELAEYFPQIYLKCEIWFLGKVASKLDLKNMLAALQKSDFLSSARQQPLNLRFEKVQLMKASLILRIYMLFVQ